MQAYWICIVFTFMRLNFTYGQHNWTICNPDVNNDIVVVHELGIFPITIRLPGQYNVTVNATIGKRIDHLMIDVQVGLENHTTGEIDLVYPLDDQYLRIYDGCLLINKLLFGAVDEVKSDIDVQIDRLFMEANSYHAGCPLLPGRITFRDITISLPADLVEFNSLPSARYVVNFLYRSDAGALLGCVDAHLNYGGHVID
ncbi:uncharacterized protein LOC128226796 [Mya arenaria]|uniref:uncharacterized protein LOC128226796 n=1 Tax=Mya arenaria TaxID=6604 RepID=UPI0022E65E19|nr:uncharacterized protein LOC128226796 [Mya arenaria]